MYFCNVLAPYYMTLTTQRKVGTVMHHTTPDVNFIFHNVRRQHGRLLRAVRLVAGQLARGLGGGVLGRVLQPRAARPARLPRLHAESAGDAARMYTTIHPADIDKNYRYVYPPHSYSNNNRCCRTGS